MIGSGKVGSPGKATIFNEVKNSVVKNSCF